jgi:hypothetical protein
MTARAATVAVAWLAGMVLGVGAAKEELQLVLMGGMLSIWVVLYFRRFAQNEPAEQPRAAHQTRPETTD